MTTGNQKLPVVLVVEDEVLIRMDVVDMIEDAGFQTYEAGSAAAAIELMERHDDIGILFTDVEMPGSMDGLSLAAYTRDRWPSIAIVIASGIVETEAVIMPEGALVIPKPYAISQITKTLHDLAIQLR